MNIFTDKVLRRSGSIDKICNIDPVGAALEAVRVMACVKRCVCKAPAKSSAVIPFSARYLAVVNAKQRGGKVWIKIFPDKPITKKALGVRMGSGKGAPETWVAVVKNQKVMFEIGGVSEEVAREALRLAQHKLPIKTRIVKKEDLDTEIGGE